MQTHFKVFREPPRYMTDSNDVAELLYTVPPRFNRFVFYAGDLPHSGAVCAYTAAELVAGSRADAMMGFMPS